MDTCIIIGGGILGTSTAYHLAKAGAHTTLIDRYDSGQSTDAAAGIVCPWVSQRRNQAWYKLAKNGAKYYSTLIPELENEGDIDTGYKQVGALCLHTDEIKLDKLEERALKRRADAPEMGDITRLTREETKNLFPPIFDEFSSVHISGAARVNGRALCQGLLQVANRYGAAIKNGNASLLMENNEVIGVEVEGEKIYADHIIVTGGAWANELFQPLQLQFLISWQKAQILHLQLPGMNTSSWPVLMPPNDQYLLAFENGKVVVGATHENIDTYDNRVTAGGVHEVLTKAISIAPGLAEAEIIETRVGFRPFTPGFLPVFGKVPGFDGLYAANGLGASGLTVGPYVGAQLTKLVLGKTLDIDASLYDVSGAIKS